MELSLLNAGLAFGAAMAVIPVVLHLILREKPKHELFPALRLIRLRHRANVRKVQIRHWLLLLLRMLLIVLMALALARPRLHGARLGLDERAPAAAALVFDTSLSMQYRWHDRTRLDVSKEIAQQLFKEMPDGSEVLVLDSADPALGLVSDPATAARRVDSLQIRPRARSVNGALLEAYAKLAESTLTRREVYVFSDLANGSFDRDAAAALTKAAGSVPGGIATYVVNVAHQEPQNVALVDVTPTADVIPANSNLLIRARVSDTGVGAPVRLELHVDGTLRGEQELKLEKNDAVAHEFPLRGLPPGFHQGEVRVRGGDALPFDDLRHFTVQVSPPLRVLVLSDSPRDAASWMQALAPDELVRQQRARYACDWLAADQFTGTKLADYSCVVLVNVERLSQVAWRALGDFVRGGGGIAVFLGDRCEPENYNQVEPQAILPARLVHVIRAQPPTSMKPIVAGHAGIRRLLEWDKSALGRVLVDRFWKVELAENQTGTIADFESGAPALAERLTAGLHVGRVLLLTTGVNPPPRSRPREEWNNLQQTDSAVTFVILADGVTQYLGGQVDERLNWRAGEDVVLRPGRDQRLGGFLLYAPGGAEPTRGSIDPAETAISVPTPEACGHYRVVVSQSSQSFEKRFSVNADAAESRLEEMPASDLTALFGKDKVVVARSLADLHRVMGDVRIGRELFPYLMLALVLILACEQFLANRFYRDSSSVGGVA